MVRKLLVSSATLDALRLSFGREADNMDTCIISIIINIAIIIIVIIVVVIAIIINTIITTSA